jgi:tetratricopeptide (TPR) repeat protein
MEIGDERGAASLIKRAIEKAPATGPPTRYLFARGLLELRQKKAEDVRKTALEILQRAQSFTSIDPSRKKDAEKASAYLNGMSFFIAGKLENAISELSRAVAMEGWEYCIYRLGLARAYLAAKRLPEALAAAKQSAEPLDSADPMIELVCAPFWFKRKSSLRWVATQKRQPPLKDSWKFVMAGTTILRTD